MKVNGTAVNFHNLFVIDSKFIFAGQHDAEGFMCSIGELNDTTGDLSVEVLAIC